MFLRPLILFLFSTGHPKNGFVTTLSRRPETKMGILHALVGEVIPERVKGEDDTFKQVMMTRAVHLFAFFVLKGGSSSGYISTGFFVQ